MSNNAWSRLCGFVLGLWVGAISVGAVGCTPRIFSPPTGTFPVETSAPLGEGASRASADAFFGGNGLTSGIASYRLSVARGLSDRLDLSLSPAVTWLHGSEPGDSHPGIYALRAGVKYAPVKHFGLVGGLGAGGSAGGGFLSPDLGFIAAYENAYVIPFLAARGLLSVPFVSREVHFRVRDYDGEPPVWRQFRASPNMSLGYQLNLGIRAFLAGEERSRARPALACSIGLTGLYDPRERAYEVYPGFACGLDVTFGAVSARRSGD